jgi:hypothetical protein
MEKKSVVEDHRHSNVKIITGILVTIIVLCSHFLPIPFPNNYYVLIACVVR